MSEMTTGAAKAILLDMGGVLLDFGDSNGVPQGVPDFRGRRALLRLLREGGGRLDLDDLERLLFAPWRHDYERRYERGSEARWEPHFQRLRRETGARGRTLAFLETWFAPLAAGLAPAGGAIEAMSRLAASGIRLGLVSNVPLPGALYRKVLGRHGLLAPLEDRRFSYDEGSRKPSPAMLRSAMRALGVRPHETWMVGDRRETDVAAGRAAGVFTVWVRSLHRRGPEPDATIRSLSELVSMVR